MRLKGCGRHRETSPVHSGRLQGTSSFPQDKHLFTFGEFGAERAIQGYLLIWEAPDPAGLATAGTAESFLGAHNQPARGQAFLDQKKGLLLGVKNLELKIMRAHEVTWSIAKRAMLLDNPIAIISCLFC